MKQHEAVIQTLEKMGGQATLAELYREVMKIKDCKWETKTPFASIRRIVQVRPEIFRVRPGLWALKTYRDKLGLFEDEDKVRFDQRVIEQNHSYYQGLLVLVGNLRGLATFIPNQDKNKLFVNKTLSELRSLNQLPAFSYPHLVHRCGTVDVSWFNERGMPHSFFEVEYSTDINNSLIKFSELQDFHSRMVIVASEVRRREFEQKIKNHAFHTIKDRVNFLGYSFLVKQYEYELLKSEQEFIA